MLDDDEVIGLWLTCYAHVCIQNLLPIDLSSFSFLFVVNQRLYVVDVWCKKNLYIFYLNHFISCYGMMILYDAWWMILRGLECCIFFQCKLWCPFFYLVFVFCWVMIWWCMVMITWSKNEEDMIRFICKWINAMFMWKINSLVIFV